MCSYREVLGSVRASSTNGVVERALAGEAGAGDFDETRNKAILLALYRRRGLVAGRVGRQVHGSCLGHVGGHLGRGAV